MHLKQQPYIDPTYSLVCTLAIYTFTINIIYKITIYNCAYENIIHLMCAPEGNREFCFPESLNFRSISFLSIVYFFKQNARKSEFTNLQLSPPFCLFIYAAGRSGQQLLTCCPREALGIHCIYLKPRDHESTNHV